MAEREELERLPVKRLAVAAAELETEIATAREAIRGQQKHLSLLERRLALAREIMLRKAQPPAEPVVTDHALVRYMGRVLGFDTEAIRESILTPERQMMIRAGATAIKGDGYVLKIEGNSVVTVVD